MGRSLKFQLTETEVETVREAINHDPRPEVRQRAKELLTWFKKTPETSLPGPSSSSLWTKQP